MSLCCSCQSHKHTGSTISAWCDIKTPGMSFPNSREKDLLQAPRTAEPSISHLLPSHLPFQASNIQLPGHWQPPHASSKDGPLYEGRRSREQKHHISRCDSPGRNTAAFIPHTHLCGASGFQRAHTTTANSGSASPPNTFMWHQATTCPVQGGVGLPHAQHPHQLWLTCCQPFKRLDTFKKKNLEKTVYYENLSPIQKFDLERFLLLNPLPRVFLLEKSSKLSRCEFSYTTCMFYLTKVFL